MPSQKATGVLLLQLRTLMGNLKYVKEPLNAYIVPSTDQHNSEYLADHHQRRAFISGFTGSAGTAVITHTNASLWTDGRYYLQASQEMDSNWTLMKEGISTTPSQGSWLSQVLPQSSNIGIDSWLISHSTWSVLQSQLEPYGHKLIAVDSNLIDVIWEDQPPLVKNCILPLPLCYSGRSVGDKISDVRKQMKERNVQVLILTALDEIAWFLNLRGSDIEFNPVFFAFVLILTDSVIISIDIEQITPTIEMHLKSETNNCENFKIEPYNEIQTTLQNVVDDTKGFIWCDDNVSYALTRIVPKKRLRTEITPIALMKAVKNPVEIAGMKNAHIKDAVALCCYFAWLESVVGVEKVTEISAARQLNDFRKMQVDYVGPSFETISSAGPHGAIIHYKPEPNTDSCIDTSSLYLCDSGGQYKDGTTDVTRTVHFGTPSDYEKECYTRVLKGQLKLARSIFPCKIKGNYLDSFAREYLWQVGLDYAHGTGHGIGSYLNVHEGPMGVSWRSYPDDPGLEAGMFISNEPGYYEDGCFGIRIEDIVEIIPAKTDHNFNDRLYLTFETITLVPKQTKLIQLNLLTKSEIEQLNSYHKKCRDVIGPILKKQNQEDALKWLLKETEAICTK